MKWVWGPPWMVKVLGFARTMWLEFEVPRDLTTGFRCFRSMSWQGMPKAAVQVPHMPFGFSSCAILRWEIPDLSMIYVLETSKRKTHQIDCPQHMSLAQTDSSILARTPQQTYHPKTSIDLPKVAKFPGKRQVVWLFQGYFLSAWHFAILGRCAWKIAMETCWWAQLRSASRSERVNWSNWDILTKKQFGSIKSLEHFWDLRIWSKSPWILTFKSQLGRWSLRSQFRIAVCCGRPWVWVKAWCPAPFQNVTQTERSHERVISQVCRSHRSAFWPIATGSSTKTLALTRLQLLAGAKLWAKDHGAPSGGPLGRHVRLLDAFRL